MTQADNHMEGGRRMSNARTRYNDGTNGPLRTGVLVAAIIVAVAGPVVASMNALGDRLDRIESRSGDLLQALDEKLQIEINASDVRASVLLEQAADQHDDQQVEIMRMRDQFDMNDFSSLQIQVQTLKDEIARLREEAMGGAN